MFAKLVVVVLTIGSCACTLLSLRQARLQAAHELTRAQLRVREADDRLWAARAEIARRVMPDQIRQMATALGSFRPMLPLPGDVERRSEYARLAPPVIDGEVAPGPHPQAVPAVRTVSNRDRGPSNRPIADDTLAANADPGPAPRGPSSRDAARPARKTASTPQPSTSKPGQNAKSSKSAVKPPKAERRQASADRPGRGP